MKALFASLSIATLVGVGAAYAQDTIVLQPEQETEIHTYIEKHPATAVEVPSDVQISVGTALPDTVELHQIEVPDVHYSYVVVDGKTVLVDPGTRKIVKIIH